MPGCEWVLVVDCSQFATAHPCFTGAQQVIGGEDGNLVGEQVFHRLQELAQVPRNAAERCGEPHRVTRLCRLAHALHGFLVEPGVDAVEDHHAVAGSSGPCAGGKRYGHRPPPAPWACATAPRQAHARGHASARSANRLCSTVTGFRRRAARKCDSGAAAKVVMPWMPPASTGPCECASSSRLLRTTTATAPFSISDEPAGSYPAISSANGAISTSRDLSSSIA